MAATILHIERRKNQWAVVRPGQTRALRVFPTRTEAIAFASEQLPHSDQRVTVQLEGDWRELVGSITPEQGEEWARRYEALFS